MESFMEPIEFGEFLKRTGFSKDAFNFGVLRKLEKVVSLRSIETVLAINAMPVEYLERLLKKIGLASDPEHKIYKRSRIHRLRVDPNGLYIGQKYVYRQKYIDIMENFKEIFHGFTISRGLSKLTPLIIFGKDKDGTVTLAHYITPIFEVHGGKMVILDGIHRDFIIKNAGTTIESIVIEKIDVPFPCEPHGWENIEVTPEKPQKMEDRYFELRPELFRDLKSVGIDG